MTKQTIEVEGLPEGWMAVAFRCPNIGEHVFLNSGVAEWGRGNKDICLLIVEKVQPRWIILEETQEDNQKNRVKNIWCSQFFSHDLVVVDQPKIWREVKATDIPLAKDEPKPKLSLSVCECKGLFEGNQPAINKVKKFIGENS